MAWFRRGTSPVGRLRHDEGSARLGDFSYDLRPKSAKIVIRLADGDPHQEELARLALVTELQTAGGRRTMEEERTDAPMEVRLFADARISGVVGVVPRGFESVIAEALSRLEGAGRKPRIPARIVSTRHGLRVELLIGQTR